MRIALVWGALLALAAATPAWGQQLQAPSQGPLVTPKLGQLEVKAVQPIPRTKIAVQLTADSALARNLRRQVMVRLARRGNEVGFSGGNVMRMDVSYFDLVGGGGGSQGNVISGGNEYQGPGSNPRPDLPANRLERRNNLPAPSAAPTLRIGLTLYDADSGKVLWVATASCAAGGGNAEQAGITMIDNIFDDADKNHIGDAGCPL